MNVKDLRETCFPLWRSKTKDKRCGIYLIYCYVDQKGYIGYTNDLYTRWTASHRSKLRYGTHNNPHLMAAWRQYGADTFDYSVVEFCESSDERHMWERENFWISKVPRDQLFNCDVPTTIGRSGFTFTMSEETKQKISASRRGRKFGSHSESTRQLRSTSMKAAWARDRELMLVKKPKGETHKNAKLTAEQVYEIRAMRGVEEAKVVAERYGVHKGYVSTIWQRRMWRHLPER